MLQPPFADSYLWTPHINQTAFMQLAAVHEMSIHAPGIVDMGDQYHIKAETEQQ